MIKLKHVSKTYVSKSGYKTKALDGVSLNIDSPQMVFVTGKSGCGKSTLLNLIGGLDTYDDGEIIMEGKSTKDFSSSDFDFYRNKYIGFVFQEYYLLDDETVEQNIALALKMQNALERTSTVDEILKTVGLGGYNKRFIGELSGGEKQRVVIARALIKSPKIILADEPTGALDSQNGKQILDLLKEVSKQRLVIVVSHDNEYAAAYADRTIEMADGRVTKDTAAKQPEDTTPSEKTKEEKLSKKRPHLPLRDSFRLGVRGLKKRKLRLAVSMLLASLALFMFGMASSFFVYNRNKVILNSMYDSDVYFARITKHLYENGTISMFPPKNMGDGDLQFWRDELKNDTVVPILTLYNGSFRKYLVLPENENDYIYLKGITFGTSGSMEMDRELAQKFNFKLLAGRYPAANNEIMISKYHYMSFEKLGYLDQETGKGIEIKTYADLLGKSFSTSYWNGEPTEKLLFDGFKIVGILDTNFDLRPYKKLFNDDNNSSDINLSTRFNEDVDTGGHALIFLNKGHYANLDEIIYKNPNREGTVETSWIYLRDPSAPAGTYFPYIGYMTELGSPFPYRAKDDAPTPLIEGFPFEIYWKDSAPRTSLNGKEAIVCMNLLKKLPSLQDLTDSQIVDKLSSGGLSQLQLGFNQWGYESIDIVGIYTLESSEDYWYSEPIFFGSGYIDYIIDFYSLYDYQGAAVALTGSIKQDSKLFNYIYSQEMPRLGRCFFYSANNIYESRVLSAEKNLKTLSVVSIFAGIALAAFASFMIFSYFATAVSDKKKEIGILRALGARRKDIFNIFVSRGIIIAAANAILAIVLTLFGVPMFNSLLSSAFGVYISIISRGALPIILISLLSGFTMLLGSIFPIMRIASKPPAEIIKSI